MPPGFSFSLPPALISLVMPPKAGFVFLQRVDCSVWDWLADFASLVFLAECAGQLRCSGLSSRSKPPVGFGSSLLSGPQPGEVSHSSHQVGRFQFSRKQVFVSRLLVLVAAFCDTVCRLRFLLKILAAVHRF